MHYPLIVVTDQKPTPDHLDELMNQYAGTGRFDEWVLGGRYQGYLNVIDRAEAIYADTAAGTARDNFLADVLSGQGLPLYRPGATLREGADAAQLSNLVSTCPIHHGGTFPRAVLMNGEWHEHNWDWEAIQLDIKTLRIQFSEKDTAIWGERFCELMRSVQPHQWLAVVDCHQ